MGRFTNIASGNAVVGVMGGNVVVSGGIRVGRGGVEIGGPVIVSDDDDQDDE
jgi:hypothetical protein